MYYSGDFDPEGLQIADKLSPELIETHQLCGYQELLLEDYLADIAAQ